MSSTGRARGRWGPVPIRLATGSGLVYNGAPKLSRAGHENIVYLLEQTGGPLPEVTSWGLGLFELGGGLAIVAGIRVRLISAAVLGTVIINLLGALRRGSFPRASSRRATPAGPGNQRLLRWLRSKPGADGSGRGIAGPGRPVIA